MAKQMNTSREEPMTDQEMQIEQLFEAAHKDEALKRRLLSNPREVAKEWNIALEDREVERLTKLGAFVELAQEAKLGRLFRACDPRVCYPATVWLHQELVNLIEDLIVFYPIPHWKDW